MSDTILTRGDKTKEPPYMRGYGDWACDGITDNPFPAGTIEAQQWELGNKEAQLDDHEISTNSRGF